MNLSLQNILLNRHSLRMSSLLIGFLLWSALSNVQYDHITVTIPLCVYGEQTEVITYKLPETISVTLKAKKNSLRAIDFTTLAAHVDAQEIIMHKNITVTNKHLLLPDSIAVACYKPLNLARY